MSLIEIALEKLRREANAEAGAASDASIAPLRPPGAVAAVTRLPSGMPEVPEASEPVQINMVALRSAGYLPEEGLERRFADHYRQIKRPLIERALSGPPEARLILVSSALPGDGKTFTSINLALSMARERDLSVLLVDADTPKARISEVLGLRRERGLLDALVDDSLDVDSLVRRTDVDGLEILPAGRFLENTTELLASTRMHQIATRIAARNPRRLVLFDTAPLLVSNEARVLLRIPGQIVLVARFGATPRQALLEALAHVDKQKLQGLILNDAPFRSGSSYYAYGDYGAAAVNESADAT